MAVVRGEADIYLHTGGQYEWDNCAPVAVAQAAGLHVSRVDGSPLRYNNADTYLPDLLICRRELADEVLRLASEYSPGCTGRHCQRRPFALTRCIEKPNHAKGDVR